MFIDTPMGTNSKMGASKADPLVNKTLYKGIIGYQLYLTTSRPNILFSVRMGAQFKEFPEDSHLKVGKRMLSYLKNTRDLNMFYHASNSFELVGSAYVNFSGYLVDRRSTSRMPNFL